MFNRSLIYSLIVCTHSKTYVLEENSNTSLVFTFPNCTYLLKSISNHNEALPKLFETFGYCCQFGLLIFNRCSLETQDK